MARLLYIKANPKPTEQSLTLQLADKFIREYQKTHPNDTVEVLDLYHSVMPIMDYERLAQYNQGTEYEIRKVAEQFKTFDKILIAAPVWNHGFPAMLNIYLDNIVYRHTTFTYKEDGKMKGLCENMKAMHIVTSAQIYHGERSHLNHHYNQIKGALGLIGLTDVDCIHLLGRKHLTKEELQDKLAFLEKEIAHKASEF